MLPYGRSEKVGGVRMGDRITRISEAVKQEMSNIIKQELKDPRIPEFVSVVSVDVTKDLKYAKVFVSVYGTDEEKQNAILGLKSASGYVRKEIGQRLNLRYTPEVHFELDNSIERGIYLTHLIDKTVKESE
jgi:ribosome-binding factor A